MVALIFIQGHFWLPTESLQNIAHRTISSLLVIPDPVFSFFFHEVQSILQVTKDAAVETSFWNENFVVLPCHLFG